MTNTFPTYPLAELHAHLAASISPSVYWEIAHDLGFKLPKKEYQAFKDYIRLSPEKKTDMKTYFDTIYHPLLDQLSSGTHALERAMYEIMSGAYRKNNITLIEIRNNPMKHNHNAQLDLDHIIMAMLRGMERALLEYDDLSAGILFCLDRNFSYQQNEIIVEKAIKYHRRGVIGIDFAGPGNPDFHFKDYKTLVQKAKDAGLRVTAHCGETVDTNDMWEALEYIQPERIGHGIKAAYDTKLMEELVKQDVLLEICPLSNVVLTAVENLEELRFIFRTFLAHKVKFSINTDWPEMIEHAKLGEQYQLLLQQGILSEEELAACNSLAFSRSFVPKGGLSAYL